MRNQKGITLIALIITIIVMLILAGVAISMAIGDNGVIEKTQGAIKEQERANVQDIIIASYIYKVAGATNTFAYIDIPKTGIAIFENLEANGFTVLEPDVVENGNGEMVNSAPLVKDENDNITGIEVTVKGDHGEYFGKVESSGLVGDVTENKTLEEEPPIVPEEPNPEIGNEGIWYSRGIKNIVFDQKYICSDEDRFGEYLMFFQDGGVEMSGRLMDNNSIESMLCANKDECEEKLLEGAPMVLYTTEDIMCAKAADGSWSEYKAMGDYIIWTNETFGGKEYYYYKENVEDLPASESTIEYYIFSIEGENGEAGYILKVDNENNSANTYGFNIEGRNVNYGGGPLTVGQKVENEMIINIDDGNGATTPDNMENGNVLKSGDAEVGYKKGKNIYMPGGAGYYCYSLVEDIEKITEIESLMATIN